MKLKNIQTEKEYKAYLKWVDEMLDEKVAPKSKKGLQLRSALLLIKQFEDINYPIPKNK